MVYSEAAVGVLSRPGGRPESWADQASASGDRRDATRVDLGRGFNAMFPFLMKGRNDSIAYYPVTIDVENLLDHLEQLKGTAEADLTSSRR